MYLDGHLCQIKGVYKDTNQVLVYDTVDKTHKLASPADLTEIFEESSEEGVQNMDVYDEEEEYHVLIVSEDGNRVQDEAVVNGAILNLVSDDEAEEDDEQMPLRKRKRYVDVDVGDRRLRIERDRVVVDFHWLLPVDIVLNMISSFNLSFDSVLSMTQVNRGYSITLNNDRVWISLLKRDYPFYYNMYATEQNVLTEAIRDAIDAYTTDETKRGMRYHKRFYELIMNMQKANVTNKMLKNKRIRYKFAG